LLDYAGHGVNVGDTLLDGRGSATVVTDVAEYASAGVVRLEGGKLERAYLCFVVNPEALPEGRLARTKYFMELWEKGPKAQGEAEVTRRRQLVQDARNCH
jgi:hypothetical protein